MKLVSAGPGNRPLLVKTSILRTLVVVLLIAGALIAGTPAGQDLANAGAARLPREIKSPEDVRPFWGAMSDRHGFISSGDGTCLFYRYWTPTVESSSEPIVLVLHGIGMHSGPYKVIADGLTPQGIGVYALDARGNGLSCGKRDHIPTPETENWDISAMIRVIRESHPDAKLFLLGDSMGGIFAANYATESSGGDLAGLVLLAPALSIARKQFLRIGNLSLLPDLLFRRNKPSVSLGDKLLNESTRDRQFVVQYRTDPLGHERVSINYLMEIHRSAAHWDKRVAPQINVPTLIVQGEKDRLVSVAGSRKLFALLSTRDKEFKAYKDVPHTLVWDPETPDVMQTVGKWIARH